MPRRRYPCETTDAEWVAAELGWRVEAVQHPDAGVRSVRVGPGQEPTPATS